MPLKCLRGQEEVYAFNVDTDEAWEDLRKANTAAKDKRVMHLLRWRLAAASPLRR